MTRAELGAKLAGVEVEGGPCSDTLEGVLLMYFDMHCDRPDEESGESGWSPWVEAEATAALARLTDFVRDNAEVSHER